MTRLFSCEQRPVFLLALESDRQTDMSGFSAELIDYLEGRITFEEFDKRRDERKTKVKWQNLLVNIKKLGNIAIYHSFYVYMLS